MTYTIFLSTPSGWRATVGKRICERPGNFYPRPPGGGRPQLPRATFYYHLFLSTPSGWRATVLSPSTIREYRHFYPRPPGGGRLFSLLLRSKSAEISIHALRVEGDRRAHTGKPQAYTNDFYPRPPGGGRLLFVLVLPALVNFYPRPPGGGRQQKRTKFSSVFAQKGEEFASLRREKREFAGGVLKRTNFGF